MTIRAEHLRARSTGLRVDLERVLPSIILAGYGVFILSLLVRGVMTWYINPTYVWPTTMAGVVLIGLAAVRLIYRREVECDHESCDCSRPTVRWWPYVGLSIPLLLAILIPPHSLADFSARQRGPQIGGLTTIRGAMVVKHVSLSVDTRSFTLQDWVGALSADPNPKDYQGKPVSVTGIVLHDPASIPPGYVMVMRYQVTCCIADARPVGLIVRDTSGGAMKDNQWVTATGTMGETTYQGQEVAVVEPKQLVATKAGSPYMY